MRYGLLAKGLCLGLWTAGCSKGKLPDKCQADTDCKNGTLCEAELCLPNKVVEKARAYDELQKKPKPKEAKEEPEQEQDSVIPLIPKQTSDPPKLADWQQASEVNTQHEHGVAKDCSIKVVREWVRVFCRGEILGYQDLVEFGKKTVDYYVSVKESSLSFVGRIKQGPRQSLRICRENDRAALVVFWPVGKERPEHIALGGGAACENNEFEEVPPKKEGAEDADSLSTQGKPPKPTFTGRAEGQLTPKGFARD